MHLCKLMLFGYIQVEDVVYELHLQEFGGSGRRIKEMEPAPDASGASGGDDGQEQPQQQKA
jgi:hypothetical protein